MYLLRTWSRVLIVLIALVCSAWLRESTSIRWVDHIDDNMDIFFDRTVLINIKKDYNGSYLKGVTILAPGVLINSQLVLTSFNPFREYIKNKDLRKDVNVSILIERHITDWKKIEYTLLNLSIACARQVIPVPEDKEFWAGEKKEQSSLHDLLVMRLSIPVNLTAYVENIKYSFGDYSRHGESSRTAGPSRTRLAKPADVLGRDLKFASLGFKNKRHVNKSCMLRSHEVQAQDNVEIGCDGWLPQEWGLFICIRNLENFKGVGSGALLIYNNKLFGVGSFLLQKGNSSILVFTDVRHYSHLISSTCTTWDQALERKPPNTTTSSTTAAP